MKLVVRNWKELLAQLPSWIESRFVPVRYAPHGNGIELTVAEIKPKLELPVFPDTVKGLSLTEHFTVGTVSRFLTTYCGTNRNYAVQMHEEWFEVANPFITWDGTRIYISADEMEAASILADMSVKLYRRYAGYLKVRRCTHDSEDTPPAPVDYAQYGL